MAESATLPSFGKYQIINRIAVGGVAEIYKARIDGIGGFHRNFAIKRILPHLETTSEFVEMLVEEAKVAGLLSHTNIVQILDLGQVDETYFIAMEYVHGPDLGRVLQRCKAQNVILPVPHAVFIMTEMLKGLEYAHNRQVMRGGRPVPLNIVHRDVCPANLLISFKGEIKLTDFGVAKASVRSLDSIKGLMKERVDYLSPEQAREEEVDRRSDLFSAGVLLYEMLTGRHPFARPKQHETLNAIKQCAFTPASELNGEVPYQLDMILSQTMHPDPGERFRSATAMKDALDRFFHESGHIFSHSTLAAFLRGLFPEDLGQGGGVSLPDVPEDEAETRPITRKDRFEHALESEEEGATGILERGSLLQTLDTTMRKPLANLDLPNSDLSQSSVFGPVGEEATIVDRPNADNQEWAELETLIRPLPEKSKSLPGPSDEPEPTHRGDTPPFGQPARPHSGPAQRQRRKRHPKRKPSTVRRTQMLSLAVGVVIVVSALLVGFVLGNRAALLTRTSPSPIAVKSDPQLEVNMPDGAVLSVDGRAVPGESPVTVPLTAGRSHDVRVTLEDHYPFETAIRLDYNDVRVLSIERGKLHPKNGSGKRRKRR